MLRHCLSAPARHSHAKRFSYSLDLEVRHTLPQRPRPFPLRDGQSSLSRVSDDELLHIDRLKAATPKILFLQGVPVLHAAACNRIRPRASVDSAGPETYTGAPLRHGRRLVSEDLLVISTHPGQSRLRRRRRSGSRVAFERGTSLAAPGFCELRRSGARVTRGPRNLSSEFCSWIKSPCGRYRSTRDSRSQRRCWPHDQHSWRSRRSDMAPLPWRVGFDCSEVLALEPRCLPTSTA